MNDAMNNWSVQVIGMALIGGAAARRCSGSPRASRRPGRARSSWPRFIAVVHFGRHRSNVLEVMSGTGDERVRSLYMRAVAFAGAVMAWVLPGWWLVTVAQGDPNETLSILCAIFAFCFIDAP